MKMSSFVIKYPQQLAATAVKSQKLLLSSPKAQLSCLPQQKLSNIFVSQMADF